MDNIRFGEIWDIIFQESKVPKFAHVDVMAPPNRATFVWRFLIATKHDMTYYNPNV